MAHQLEIWLRPSAESSAIFLPAPRTAHCWKWASATLGFLLIVAIVAFRMKGPAKPPPAHAPVSVRVADFANTTGDSIFDETLEPPLSVALEDALFITALNRNQVQENRRPASARHLPGRDDGRQARFCPRGGPL